jgi:crotonobetainyl-CoA:carnitine CoA-transferase CaiB-like acyl-CoA transferase
VNTRQPSWVVRAEDGWLGFDVPTAQAWGGVCAALGLDHLRGDPRCVSVDERARHRAALLADLEAVTSRWMRHELSLALACEEVDAFVVVAPDRERRS